MFSKFWNLNFTGLPKFIFILINVSCNKLIELFNSIFWIYNLRECGDKCIIQKGVTIRYPRNIYFGDNISIVRPSNTYGPYDHFDIENSHEQSFKPR